MEIYVVLWDATLYEGLDYMGRNFDLGDEFVGLPFLFFFFFFFFQIEVFG